MSPNPYRSALLGFAMLCLGVGFALFLLAISETNVTTSVDLAALGGNLMGAGVILFVLWLVASAIIHGITVTPKLTPGSGIGGWLNPSSTPPPAKPSYLDEDGL